MDTHRNILPETGFLRISQVLQFIPFSRSTLWLRVREGTFPSPVKFGLRMTGWRSEAIRDFIENPEKYKKS